MADDAQAGPPAPVQAESTATPAPPAAPPIQKPGTEQAAYNLAQQIKGSAAGTAETEQSAPTIGQKVANIVSDQVDNAKHMHPLNDAEAGITGAGNMLSNLAVAGARKLRPDAMNNALGILSGQKVTSDTPTARVNPYQISPDQMKVAFGEPASWMDNAARGVAQFGTLALLTSGGGPGLTAAADASIGPRVGIAAAKWTLGTAKVGTLMTIGSDPSTPEFFTKQLQQAPRGSVRGYFGNLLGANPLDPDWLAYTRAEGRNLISAGTMELGIGAAAGVWAAVRGGGQPALETFLATAKPAEEDVAEMAHQVDGTVKVSDIPPDVPPGEPLAAPEAEAAPATPSTAWDRRQAETHMLADIERRSGVANRRMQELNTELQGESRRRSYEMAAAEGEPKYAIQQGNSDVFYDNKPPAPTPDVVMPDHGSAEVEVAQRNEAASQREIAAAGPAKYEAGWRELSKAMKAGAHRADIQQILRDHDIRVPYGIPAEDIQSYVHSLGQMIRGTGTGEGTGKTVEQLAKETAESLNPDEPSTTTMGRFRDWFRSGDDPEAKVTGAGLYIRALGHQSNEVGEALGAAPMSPTAQMNVQKMWQTLMELHVPWRGNASRTGSILQAYGGGAEDNAAELEGGRVEAAGAQEGAPAPREAAGEQATEKLAATQSAITLDPEGLREFGQSLRIANGDPSELLEATRQSMIRETLLRNTKWPPMLPHSQAFRDATGIAMEDPRFPKQATSFTNATENAEAAPRSGKQFPPSSPAFANATDAAATPPPRFPPASTGFKNATENVEATPREEQQFGPSSPAFISATGKAMAKDEPPMSSAMFRAATKASQMTEWDKAKASFSMYMINNMIGGVPTYEKVAMSQMFQMLHLPMETFVGGGPYGIRAVKKAIGGDFSGALADTKAGAAMMTQGLDQFAGLVTEANQAMRAAARSLRSGQSHIDPGSVIFPGGRISPEYFDLGQANYLYNVVGAPGRIHTTMTEFTKTLIYRSWVRSQALRSATEQSMNPEETSQLVSSQLKNAFDPEGKAMGTNITATGGPLQDALYQARRASLTQPLDGTLMGKRVHDLLEKYPLSRLYAAPFQKIGTNAFSETWSMMPGLAAAKASVQQQFKNGGDDWARAYSNQMIGASATATLMMAAMRGHLTGAPPADKDLRDQQVANGVKPYSFTFGGVRVPLDRIPFVGSMVQDTKDIGDGVSALRARQDSQSKYWQEAQGNKYAYMDNHPVFQHMRQIADFVSGTRGTLSSDGAKALSGITLNLTKNSTDPTWFGSVSHLLEIITGGDTEENGAKLAQWALTEAKTMITPGAAFWKSINSDGIHGEIRSLLTDLKIKAPGYGTVEPNYNMFGSEVEAPPAFADWQQDHHTNPAQSCMQGGPDWIQTALLAMGKSMPGIAKATPGQDGLPDVDWTDRGQWDQEKGAEGVSPYARVHQLLASPMFGDRSSEDVVREIMESDEYKKLPDTNPLMPDGPRYNIIAEVMQQMNEAAIAKMESEPRYHNFALQVEAAKEQKETGKEAADSITHAVRHAILGDSAAKVNAPTPSQGSMMHWNTTRGKK